MELNFRTHRQRNEPNKQVWLLHFLTCSWALQAHISFSLGSMVNTRHNSFKLPSTTKSQVCSRTFAVHSFPMFLQEGIIKPVFNFHYLFHMYSCSNAFISPRLKIPLIHSLFFFFFSHAYIYFKFPFILHGIQSNHDQLLSMLSIPIFLWEVWSLQLPKINEFPWNFFGRRQNSDCCRQYSAC